MRVKSKMHMFHKTMSILEATIAIIYDPTYVQCRVFLKYIKYFNLY